MGELGDTLALVLTIVVMVAGLVLTVIPQVPGVLIIWLAVLGYALLDRFQMPGPVMFGLLTLLGLAGTTTDLWMKLLGAKTGGASVWGMLAGLVFGLVGLILFFPLGGIIGSVAGVMLVEGLRARSLGAALRSGGGTLGGYLLSMVVEFGLGALIIALFLITVL